MADKQVTVAVPEERVPEFYVWFGRFLASDPGASPAGGPPPRGAPRGRGRGLRHALHEPGPWTGADADAAAWLYGRLAPPARELFDALMDQPGERVPGNELAARLGLDKGAHGVAGILAWPGRYSRKLARALPIATEGRPDGGTDYYMDAATAALFARARERARGGARPEPSA